jgi:enolase
MAAFDVADLSAPEILDSRGRFTVSVTLRPADGTTAQAGVPARGERVASYNRLIEIAATAPTVRYGMP